MELLGIKDFEDSEVGLNWGRFDYLLEVARVGYEKLVKNKNDLFKNKQGEEDNEKKPGLVYSADEDNALKLESKSLMNKSAGLKRKLKIQEKEQEQEQEEEDGERERLKPKRSKRVTAMCPNPEPDLPGNFKEHIMQKMGGRGWTLVIQKPIFFSDINSTASRFSIPFSQIKTHDFLYKNEAEDLDKKKAVQVRFLEPSLKETTLTLKRWNMRKSSMYVLTTKWNSVVKNNGLKTDEVVQLWAFRVESDLCFALVKVDDCVLLQGSQERFSQGKSREDDASSSNRIQVESELNSSGARMLWGWKQRQRRSRHSTAYHRSFYFL